MGKLRQEQATTPGLLDSQVSILPVTKALPTVFNYKSEQGELDADS